MNGVIPSERFVNDTLLEGLCYSFGVRRCGYLCNGYNVTSVHVSLFNFENFDWLWDSRCMEKQLSKCFKSLWGEVFQLRFRRGCVLYDQATQCQIVEKLQPQSDSGTRVTLFL